MPGFLTAILLIGGAAAFMIHRAKTAYSPWGQSREADGASDAEKIADESGPEDEPITGITEDCAEVVRNKRQFSTKTFAGHSSVTFSLTNGRSLTAAIENEDARTLQPGEKGVLTRQAGQFVSFRRADGTVIAQLFTLPPEAE